MSLAELLEKQATASDIIIKFTNNYKRTALVKRTKGFVSERLAAVKRLWADYVSNHYKICHAAQSLTSTEKEKYDYFSKDQYSELEEKYYEFLGLLRDALNVFDPPSSPRKEDPDNAAESSSFLKLPRITLPTFSGSYESWRSFHDLFDSLVHQNPALPAVQKLHYLKTSVTGEAEHLLRQFPITHKSYENAWKTLVDRYDNKRVLVNAQLRILCNLPKITHESAKAIKTLLDKSSECLFELEALGVPTKQWDAVLVYMLVQCLPTETHRLWEQEVNNSEGLPTFDALKTFLETRFRTLEAISDSKLSPTNKPIQNANRVSTHFSSTVQQCVVCKEQHPLFKCPKFHKFNVDTKFKIVTSNRLCVNCMSKEHNIKSCPSKFTCRQCGRKHHSLLHRNKKTINSKPQLTQNLTPNSTQQTQLCDSPTANSSLQTFYTKRPQRAEQALLATALINIPSRNGTIHTLRALIDSGSQVSFITQAAARKLQAPTSNVSVQITGLGKTETTNVQTQATLKIYPQKTSYDTTTITALIVPTITDLLPPSSIPFKEWSHIKDL